MKKKTNAWFDFLDFDNANVPPDLPVTSATSPCSVSALRVEHRGDFDEEDAATLALHLCHGSRGTKEGNEKHNGPKAWPGGPQGPDGPPSEGVGESPHGAMTEAHWRAWQCVWHRAEGETGKPVNRQHTHTFRSTGGHCHCTAGI